MQFIKRIIKSFLRNVIGLDVYWVDSAATPMAQLVASLRKFDIDLVLDVGANKGQFASNIRKSGYSGRIVSFEPLSNAYAGLQKACERDLLWENYPRCALGDHDGEVEINISGNSESSSILPMLELHRSLVPESAYQGKETVPIKRLDAVAGEILKGARAPFLKIDTQGFEWQVLDGARDILPHLKGVMVELSIAPLYDGQRLWRDVIDRLETEGFALWTFKSAFSDPSMGRTLQIDGVFYRTS